MQTYLLPLQACLTFKIGGTASLPAVFPGSSTCFQDCEDDSGEWHAEAFSPAPSACGEVCGVASAGSCLVTLLRVSSKGQKAEL